MNYRDIADKARAMRSVKLDREDALAWLRAQPDNGYDRQEANRIINEVYDEEISSIFHLTDLGNAERLIALYGGDIKYCYARNSWLIWAKTHWRWDDGSGIRDLAQRTVRSIYEEAANEEDKETRKQLADWAKASESNMRVSAMIAQAQPMAAVSLENLNSNHWLFNCLNGTVDLKTGFLQPHRKDDLLTTVCPVNYDMDARSSIWDSFIKRICNDNENIIGYLQRCIGYTLTGDTTEQCLFFAHGSGMNGKSTFLEVFMDIAEPYSIQANIEMFLASYKQGSAGHSEDIANLAGKRFVVASEITEGRKLAVSKIKQMTGGERVRASHKHEREFEYEVTYKIWLNGNHKPDITDTTYSIWRRVKLIPFTVTIPKSEQIKGLRYKLRSEHPAILTWAVRGCLDWQKVGLEEPPEVSNAVEEYRLEQDILAEFFNAKCFINPHDAECVVSHKELYTAYQAYCAENSLDPVNSRTFSRKLNEKDAIRKFTGHGQIKWRFIRLLKEDEKAQRVDEVVKVDDFSSYSLCEGKKVKEYGNGLFSSTRRLEGVDNHLPEGQKEEVLSEYPTGPCKACGSEDFWLDQDKKWKCCRCNPEPNN